MSYNHMFIHYSLVCAKLFQSHPTLGDPVDCSPPGSSAQGILQARTGEWAIMPSSRAVGDLPYPVIESASPATPALQADSLLLSHQGSSFIDTDIYTDIDTDRKSASSTVDVYNIGYIGWHAYKN